MWEWSDKLKLDKSSAFVKRDIRSLPQTDAEFEADFFHDPKHSTERQEHWVGIAVQREDGSVLAVEEVPMPPPTVNGLASLLAHAMLRPLTEGNRRRPSTIYLRDRPQWQELLPHLQQLGVEIVFSEDLPRFDEAVMEWIQKTRTTTRFDEALIRWMLEAKRPTKVPVLEEIRVALRKPFPERKRTWFTDAMALMDWSYEMFKGAYPSRGNSNPAYTPEIVIMIRLATEELEAILTKTDITKTKKFRPKLQVMAAEGKPIELDIHEWSNIVSALCGVESDRKLMLKMATRIANQLAQALNIEPPTFSLK
jgi:hypothetical protein